METLLLSNRCDHFCHWFCRQRQDSWSCKGTTKVFWRRRTPECQILDICKQTRLTKYNTSKRIDWCFGHDVFQTTMAFTSLLCNKWWWCWRRVYLAQKCDVLTENNKNSFLNDFLLFFDSNWNFPKWNYHWFFCTNFGFFFLKRILVVYILRTRNQKNWFIFFFFAWIRIFA